MQKSPSFLRGLTSQTIPPKETVNRVICETLPIMCAHWARRNQRLLVLNAGLGFHLQNLWEAGFDITAHATSAQELAQAQSILGHRAEYMLSPPDSLMCDDNFFDYALYLGALAEEPPAQMAKVFAELHRTTVSGILVVFINTFSVFQAKTAMGKLRKNSLYATAYPACNPLSIRLLVKKQFPQSYFHWSFLSIPPRFFQDAPHWRRRTRQVLRWCPFNALYALRIDFAPQPGTTGLVLRANNIHA